MNIISYSITSLQFHFYFRRLQGLRLIFFRELSSFREDMDVYGLGERALTHIEKIGKYSSQIYDTIVKLEILDTKIYEDENRFDGEIFESILRQDMRESLTEIYGEIELHKDVLEKIHDELEKEQTTLIGFSGEKSLRSQEVIRLIISLTKMNEIVHKMIEKI